MNEQIKGDSRHRPVLLDPAIAGLKLRSDGCYVDGTFGRGGHAGAILGGLGSQGRLLAIDRDPAAIAAVPDSLRSDPRVELIHGRMAELERIARERDLLGGVDGLLLDLGVSSPQLDEPERGFSFRLDGPLDMRMDPQSGQDAAGWLADVDEKTLKGVLKQFGEEPFAARIARAIVAARRLQPILRTRELAEIVAAAVPGPAGRRHPATRTFQAIRIFINRELDELRAALAASLAILRPGGRLCVISFHSLEDRIVKRFIRDASRVPEPYRGLPDVPEAMRPRLKPVGRALGPSPQEVVDNPRARSARLRIGERL